VPWKRLADFQLEVLARQSVKEMNAPKDAFLDRAIPDGAAYCLDGGISVPQRLWEQTLICAPRYKRVFLLDPLPYKKDGVRMEDPVRAARLHEAIRDMYSVLGADIRHVPVMSVTDRARFVLVQCKIALQTES
jgi:predicted ATPase